MPVTVLYRIPETMQAITGLVLMLRQWIDRGVHNVNIYEASNEPEKPEMCQYGLAYITQLNRKLHPDNCILCDHCKRNSFVISCMAEDYQKAGFCSQECCNRYFNNLRQQDLQAQLWLFRLSEIFGNPIFLCLLYLITITSFCFAWATVFFFKGGAL